MTSIIVLVPDTGQVLLQKNLCGSPIPSVTYLPLGAAFNYGQRVDSRLEKFRCENYITSFLPVSQFVIIVCVQKQDVPFDEEDRSYLNLIMQEFAAGMVFLKGRCELDSHAFVSCDINLHTNRLQRDFQMFSPFFDRLAKSEATPSLLLNTSDFIISDKRDELTDSLELFAENCECIHACIMVNGKVEIHVHYLLAL